MARRRRPTAATVVAEGIRGFQAARFQARLDGLSPARPTFDRERARLQERICQLEAGAVVHVEAWELAEELVAVAGLRSRWDVAPRACFRIEGDGLIAEDWRDGAA